MIDDIPEAFFSQMRTCQTAANEFLRQFWAAMAPPVTEAVLAPQTPAQRVAKAAKMAAYLSRTHEKVSALVAAGMSQGIDPQKIQTVCSMFLGCCLFTNFDLGSAACVECRRPCFERTSCTGSEENARSTLAFLGHGLWKN